MRTSDRFPALPTSGFTANINADMQVGARQETVTVTGATPLVDVQNVRQQTVVARTEIESSAGRSVTVRAHAPAA